ncbi:class F sortase [Falsarthrobacter nasiphocae]|uniref:Sortase family protein n=1 Tax=Falsarthrobacter nasiphocae TaxID=189863 RepID=A0AAE3YIY6_9MICC|nr:class F sortase [Falsarthrobacter nasiphocae]MDR6892901.1 hypothetical protein [Falsarthrobacter nasiphocae]
MARQSRVRGWIGLGLLLGLVTGAAFAAWLFLRGPMVASQPKSPGDLLAVDEDGLRVAPNPARQFRAAQCDRQPQAEITVEPMSWSVPSLGVGAQVVWSGQRRVAVYLPDPPQGVLLSDGPGVYSAAGAAVMAGHVDDAQGRLTPWGALHRLEPCNRIYARDSHGGTREFVVTDLYTVGQRDILKEDIYRILGPKELVLVTCSGPTVGEAGSPFAFRYEHNLIVRAAPVDERPRTVARE